MPSASAAAAGSVVEFEVVEIAPGLRLHLNREVKLKTTIVEASLACALDEDPTRTALIPHVLVRGTERLPDARAISRFLEDLYDADLEPDVIRHGDRQAPLLRLEVAHRRYLPGGGGRADGRDPLREGLALLGDLFFRPRLDPATDAFPEAVVRSEKAVLGREIRGLRDDRADYALERCGEEVARGEPASRYELGSVEDLPAIEPVDLAARWRDLVRRYPLDVLVVGDHDLAEVEAALRAGFPLERRARTAAELAPAAPSRPTARALGTPLHVVVERAQVEQAQLCLGYRTGIGYVAPEYAALLVFNAVFGGDGRSRLFQNVREKAGLAYEAASVLDRQKGIVTATLGIDPENVARVIGMVEAEATSLARGEIAPGELEDARKSVLLRLRDLEDDPIFRIGFERARTLEGRRDVTYVDLVARVASVTADEIAAVARRAALDTILALAAR